MKRVPEVADVWYDSGAMPYAQAHFPFDGAAGRADRQKKPPAARENGRGAEPPAAFPADYIAEGMDQLRGWFYTLIAIATALGYEAPYRNVITFGLMNDKFGNKMSKSKGNVIEPFEIINKYGVDAVRWYFYAGTPFSEPKNFDEQEVAKSFRKVHLIIYNSFVFWRTYAAKGSRGWIGRGSGGGSRAGTAAPASRTVLDAWIVARFGELAALVTDKLDAYAIREAALDIERFVDDLSRWYIRRSRRRLQRPEDRKDYEAASATLGFVLRELAKLMAPFTPFFAESLYAALGGGKESVHLEDWPEVSSRGLPAPAKKLIARMAIIRDLAAAGLAKRAEAGIKVRQPLAAIFVAKSASAADALSDRALAAILAEEVNVKRTVIDSRIKEGVALDVVITPALREEGILRDVIRMAQELRQTAGLAPRDRIALMLDASDEVRAAVVKREAALRADVGAKSVSYARSDKFIAEQKTKLEGSDLWIGLRKV